MKSASARKGGCTLVFYAFRFSSCALSAGFCGIKLSCAAVLGNGYRLVRGSDKIAIWHCFGQFCQVDCKLLYANALRMMLQKVVSCSAKGGRLRGERPCSAMRNTAFCILV